MNKWKVRIEYDYYGPYFHEVEVCGTREQAIMECGGEMVAFLIAHGFSAEGALLKIKNSKIIEVTEL